MHVRIYLLYTIRNTEKKYPSEAANGVRDEWAFFGIEMNYVGAFKKNTKFEVCSYQFVLFSAFQKMKMHFFWRAGIFAVEFYTEEAGKQLLQPPTDLLHSLYGFKFKVHYLSDKNHQS